MDESKTKRTWRINNPDRMIGHLIGALFGSDTDYGSHGQVCLEQGALKDNVGILTLPIGTIGVLYVPIEDGDNFLCDVTVDTYNALTGTIGKHVWLSSWRDGGGKAVQYGLRVDGLNPIIIPMSVYAELGNLPQIGLHLIKRVYQGRLGASEGQLLMAAEVSLELYPNDQNPELCLLTIGFTSPEYAEAFDAEAWGALNMWDITEVTGSVGAEEYALATGNLLVHD